MLYKYRGTQAFRNIVDILLNRRLYAAPYFDLNDPMEGHYLFSVSGSLDEDMKRMLKGEKDKLRICSLSRNANNELMWSHYAEGHRGIVLGVNIDRKRYEVKPVRYDGLMKLGLHNFNRNSALDVLTNKLEVWEYEEEERAFVRGSHYINVELQEVICGSRMSTQDRGMLKDLMRKVCPDVNFKTRG